MFPIEFSTGQAFNQLEEVSDEDEEGGFILVRGNGVGDPSTPDENWGSWNCSRTDGPLGAPCVLPRPGRQFNRNFIF